MQIYLDNAATSSPKPDCVIQAVTRALYEVNANPGRSGYSRSLEAGREILSCREGLARLIGANDPLSVSFQFNCTDALNLAIKGVLQKGDHVISTFLEHNSVLRVLMGLQSRGLIDVSLARPTPDGAINPDEMRRLINSRTRLIVMTHASNVTGAVQPVAAVGKIAKELGIFFLIDGAQALGMMPVDINKLGCDMYAFPGHKGLLGPQGTGGLYIKPGLRIMTLREGGTGSSSDSMLQPGELPERYESGTLNYHGIAGLGAGVEYVSKRIDAIYTHERELTTYLYDSIRAINGTIVYSPDTESGRSGIVSFNINDLSSSQAADALSEMGFAVRGGLHCAPGTHMGLNTIKRGAVRASVGHATTFEEIDRFVQALNKL